MSKWLNRASLGALLCALAGVAAAAPAGHYGYGTPATPAQIRRLGYRCAADGAGLPEGSGSVDKGSEVLCRAMRGLPRYLR